MKKALILVLTILSAGVVSAQTPNGGYSSPSAGSSSSSSGSPNCIAASASGTAYTCSTSPTFVPAAGNSILFKADVANTGAVTLNVNSSSAAPVKKQGGGTALVANDLLASQWVGLIFDGTNWQMQGQAGNAPVFFDLTKSPDVPPTSANAMDDEFNTSSLSGTWATLGTSTNTVANGFLDINVAANADSGITGITQALPAAPYKFVTKMECGTILENFHTCGMFFRESGTGKILIAELLVQAITYTGAVTAAPIWRVGRYTSATAFSTDVYPAVAAGPQGPYADGNNMYIRLGRSGSTLTVELSKNGTGWQQVYSESITSSFTTAPDQIGLAAHTLNVTNPTDSLFWYFRRTL